MTSCTCSKPSSIASNDIDFFVDVLCFLEFSEEILFSEKSLTLAFREGGDGDDGGHRRGNISLSGPPVPAAINWELG